MHIDDYQYVADQTSATSTNTGRAAVSRRLDELTCRKRNIRLLHSVAGLMTEAGELMDTLKRHLFYGEAIDNEHVAEELGDAAYYLAEGCSAIGKKMSEVLEANNAKLQARYGEGFSEHAALNRDLDAEKFAMRGEDE